MERNRTSRADPDASSSRSEYGEPRPLNLGCRIFISHSGKNKNFVRHLHRGLVDQLYRYDEAVVFFDEASLPTAERISMANILAEAVACELGILVLTQEFFTETHNPMLELVTLTTSKKRLLPLFFGFSVDEFKKMKCKNVWEEKWMEWLKKDEKKLGAWKGALDSVDLHSGLEYWKYTYNEVSYIDAILDEVAHIVRPAVMFSEKGVCGMDRLCEIVNDMYNRCASKCVSDGCIQAVSTSASAGCGEDRGRTLDLVGVYGFPGLGKTTLCRGLCDYYDADFHGRVCCLELGPVPGSSQALSQTHSSDSALKSRMHCLLLKLIGKSFDGALFTTLPQMKNLVRNWVKKYPIFLAIDNILPDSEEARFYLECEFAKGSKIFITSRSRELLEEETSNYTSVVIEPIPKLTVDEARDIFVGAIPGWLQISNVGDESVKECVSKCLIDTYDKLPLQHDVDNKWYHPLMLKSVGKFIGYGFTRDVNLKIRLRKFLQLAEGVDKTYALKMVFDTFDISFEILEEDAKKVLLDMALFCKVSGPWDAYKWIQTLYSHLGKMKLDKILSTLEDLSFIREGCFKDKEFRVHDLMAGFLKYKMMQEADHPLSGDLRFSDCPALRSIGGIMQFIWNCCLEKVAVEDLFESVKTVSSKLKATVTNLRVMHLYGFAGLEELAVRDVEHGVLLISTLVKAQATRLKTLEMFCKEDGNCGCDKIEPHFGLGLSSIQRFAYHCPQVRNLGSLPLIMGNRLRDLSLRGCGNVEVWLDFVTMTSLENLDLSYTSLKEQPTGVQLLRRLRKLDVQGCQQLPAEEMIKAITCKPLAGCNTAYGGCFLACLLTDLRCHRRDRASVAAGLDSQWPELVSLFYEQWRYLHYPCPIVYSLGRPFDSADACPGTQLCYLIRLMYVLWFGDELENGSTCINCCPCADGVPTFMMERLNCCPCGDGVPTFRMERLTCVNCCPYADGVPTIKEKMKRLLCSEIFMSLPFYSWRIARARLHVHDEREEYPLDEWEGYPWPEGYEIYMAVALIGSASIGCFNAALNDDLKDRMVNFVQSIAKAEPQHAIDKAFGNTGYHLLFETTDDLGFYGQELLCMRVGDAVCKMARAPSVAAALGQDFMHITMDGLETSVGGLSMYDQCPSFDTPGWMAFTCSGSGDLDYVGRYPRVTASRSGEASMQTSMSLDDDPGARVLLRIMPRILPVSILQFYEKIAKWVPSRQQKYKGFW